MSIIESRDYDSCTETKLTFSVECGDARVDAYSNGKIVWADSGGLTLYYAENLHAARIKSYDAPHDGLFSALEERAARQMFEDYDDPNLEVCRARNGRIEFIDYDENFVFVVDFRQLGDSDD